MSNELTSAEEKIAMLETHVEILTKEIGAYKEDYEEFLLIASHDLQAPLRKLSTFVDRLSDKYSTLSEEDAKSLMARITAASANMKSLVDNLASLSALSGELHKLENCDLNNILHDVIHSFQQYESEKLMEIHPFNLPVIEGNCIYLQHLFQNLIGNAVKFKKKDIDLQIGIYSEILNEETKMNLKLFADKVYHKIEITDNGIGFDEKHAERIFKPFERLHGKSAYPGDGLGLSICKKIVEKHKGIIYANSAENKGARFILILPETHN